MHDEQELLKKKLSALHEEEKALLENYTSDYSAYVSTAVFLETLPAGIEIIKFSYVEGEFKFEGRAEKREIFYNYFRKLEKNPNIVKLSFHQIGFDDNSGKFIFKITVNTGNVNEVR